MNPPLAVPVETFAADVADKERGLPDTKPDGAAFDLVADLEARLLMRERQVEKLFQDWKEDHCYAQEVALRCGATHDEINKAMRGSLLVKAIIDLIASKVPRGDRP